MRGTTEVKVGLFAAAAIVAAVYFSMATSDNPFKDKGYVLHARLTSAEGLQPGSAVELAGVRIGAIDTVRIEAGRAVVDLSMDPGYSLPLDSRIAVASRGILGDTVLKVSSGTSDTALQAEDWIESLEPPPSLKELQEQLGVIATDIEAITGTLRTLLSSEETIGGVQSIITNIEAFTHDLQGITRDNRSDLDAVVDNLRVLSEQLGLLVQESRPDVVKELESIQEATDTLNRGLRRVESIATKIDDGEGSLGMLVNDDRLTSGLTDMVGDLGTLVESINRFQIEVYYRGEFHITHRQPNARFSGKNTIGVRVMPRPDYWYVFEVVDDPSGSFSEETLFVDDGSGFTSVREVRQTRKLQFTLQFAKRYRDLTLRLGIKEGSGGFGADLWLLDDHLGLSLDIFDFVWASWPDQRGIPNIKFAVDVVPIKNIYLTAGTDNIVNRAIHGEFTWFVGGGVWFTDNDIKWVLGTLPSGAL
jgi:phospholipid/cholesterol/gamma-HCH transport system substrate-binding protein